MMDDGVPAARAAARFAERTLEIAESATVSDASPLRVAIGPHTAEMRFGSEDLRGLFAPSFLPAVDDAQPSMVVSLWDPHTGAADLPPLPWPKDAYRACGEIRGYSEGRHYIRFDVPMQSMTVFDTSLGRGAYFNRAPLELPAYDAAGPLKWLIHRASVEEDMLLAHCAAVASQDRAAIVVGPRGAGKSTTALACLAAGLDYLGDDRCLLAIKPTPTVHAVYTRAKMFATDRTRFGMAAISDGAIRPPRDIDGKLHIPVDRVAPLQFRRQAQISCILILKRGDQEYSSLEPTQASVAARLLVSEIIGQSPVTAARSLDIASRLCRAVPVRTLVAGRDLSGVASVIASALNG